MNRLRLPSFYPFRHKLLLIAIVVLVAGLGTYMLLRSFAANAPVTIEPENGAISNPAARITDSSASGGAAVKFAEPPGTVATIRFGSWNTLSTANTRNVGTELLDLFRFADIVGTQELSDSSQFDSVDAKLLCSSCDYSSTKSTHTYDGSSPNKVLLLWRKAKFTKVSSGFVDVSPYTTVEGGVVAAPRFIPWAKLKDNASGKQFYAMNTHMWSTVESGGHPRTENPKSLALYKTHMDKMVAQITTFKADNIPIFVTGDFNVNYRYDSVVKDPMFPFVRMGSVGVKSGYDALNLAGIASSEGTFSGGTRLIDYLWHLVRSDVTVKDENISASTHGSDHFALFTTVELK